MKKNSLRSVAVLSAMCAVFATGCSKGIDINNEQNDIIANYAARIVVRTTKVNYLYTPDIKDTQPGVPTLPFPLEKAFLTLEAVLFLLSVSASTMIATPLGPYPS